MKRRPLVALLGLLSAAGLALAEPDAKPAPTTPKEPAPKTPATGKPTPSDSGDKSKDKGKEKVEPTLKAGSAAPALHMTEWVKGSAVTGFEKGKVYVVEFWATWCGPCIKSIPHLTKVQKDHKEIIVIGVASSEKEKETSAKLKKVKDFVEKQGEKMEYTVGLDAERKMQTDWLAAAGQKGIPCAFVVGGDGKIAWIGNPLRTAEFDEAIEKAIKAAATSGPKVDGGSKKG